MNKLFLALCFTLSVGTANASELTAHCPKSCEPVSSEFSTGGGNKTFYILELLCKDKDTGQYTTYIAQHASVGGMLGFGRITAPDRIRYVEWDKDELKLD